MKQLYLKFEVKLMRIFHNTTTDRYIIFCHETKKSTPINFMGAMKVSRACDSIIEKFSADDLKLELKKIKG
jgi:hypothetical protein